MADETATVTESVGAALVTVGGVHPKLDIDALKVWLLALLPNDAILKAALGATATNQRVYSYYQPSAIISAQFPAYITYALTALPEATGATEEPVLTLAIWGLDLNAVRTVRNRLLALLHERPLYLADGTRFWGTKISERDSHQENTSFAGRQLVFRFGFSKV